MELRCAGLKMITNGEIVMNTALLERVVEEVSGWLSIAEAELLFTLAREWPSDSRCVELGSFQGRSTICTALGLKHSGTLHGKFLSIDTHKGSKEHQPCGWAFDPCSIGEGGVVNTEILLRRNLARFHVDHLVEVFVGKTVDLAESFSDQIRILFVDADHRLEAVRSDVKAWSKHVPVGGCIALHDVGNWTGPTIVAGELLARGFEHYKQSDTLLALRRVS